MASRLVLGLAIVGVFGVASCAEIPEPEGFSIATVTSEASPADVASGIGEPAVAAQSNSPNTTEFVPSAPPDYLPEVLISTELAVFSAGEEAARPLDGSFAGLRTARAVDDLLGGLVIQESGGGDVVWLPAESAEPEILDRAGAQLLDVGYVGGSPFAVVHVGDGLIDRIRLVDGARTPMIRLEDDEQVLALSASGGLHAMVVANDRCGDLRFYSAEGDQVDLNGPGEPDCIVPRRAAYGAVGLSPDGGALVYTVVSYRDDGIEVATELVARDLDTGTDFLRRKIGEDGDRITALSFDGERVAYLRQSDQTASVTILNLTDEQETPVDLEGIALIDSVSFARLPLASSGL